MDWKNIIAELSSVGINQYQIAKELDLTQATVSRVSSGIQKDMKWADGQCLLAFHRIHCGKKPVSTATEPA